MAALDALSGPAVSLLGQTFVSAAGVGGAFSGFADMARLELTVKVAFVRGNRSPSLLVSVQGSADGVSWSTEAGPFTFGRSGGSASASLDSPPDQLRVSWAVAGGLREAAIGSVVVVPGVVDVPGPGGPVALDDLSDVDTAGGSTGDVLTQQGDGSFALEPAGGGSQPAGFSAPDGTTIIFDAPNYPYFMFLHPDGTSLWIVSVDDSVVLVFDLDTETFADPIGVGSTPNWLAFTPDGTRAYVTNGPDGTVSVIDVATKSVTDTITVGSNPVSLAVTPDGTTVYVANGGDGPDPDEVSVIEVASGDVTATVTVGNIPAGVVITPDGSSVYVSNSADATISVIATATNLVTDTLADIGTQPTQLAITGDGEAIYVIDVAVDNTWILDVASGTITGSFPYGGPSNIITLSHDDTKLAITRGNINAVLFLNLPAGDEVVTVTVGDTPAMAAFTADDKNVYVTNYGDETLGRIIRRPYYSTFS